MIIIEVFEQEFYLDNVDVNQVIEMLKQQANFEVEIHLNWLIIMRRPFTDVRRNYEKAIIKVISDYNTVSDLADCLKSGWQR
jgi:hypothetical protein